MKKLYFSLITTLFLVVANAQIINIPNVNFKTKLISLGVDTNSDGEIQNSEAIAQTSLDLSSSSISSLTGIESFTNLQSLHCYSNQLTSLNLTGLTSLETLNCSFNQLMVLNVNGLTSLQNLICKANLLTNIDISGLVALHSLDCSENQLLSIDVSNLTNLQTLNCTYNQLINLNVSNLTNLQILDCGTNLLTSLTVSGSTNLQYLYCSSNQLASLNVSGLTNLETFDCRTNLLTSVNISDLTSLNSFNCSENQLQSIDVRGLTNLQYFFCKSNLLTSLFIKNGVTNWISLQFEENPNLVYICADEEDLATVQQRINYYGYSATCQVNSYCSFTPGGTFYTIQGNNKIDFNNNGCDVSDSIYPNLKFNITNGTISGSLISTASGNYSIPVSAGNHSITPQFESPTYFTTSPTDAVVTFPATTSPFIQDFCITPNGIHHDLEVVVIPVIPSRPGFDATYKIKYKNKGTISENTTVTFNYNDAILDLVSSNVAPTTQATGTLSFNVGTIAPFQSGEILLTLNLNSTTETPPVNAGNILSYTATVNGLNTDETTIDNTFTLNQVVVNSYDPNDKKCLEGETLSSSKIGEYVHYKIRFENTGTYPAQNIVVKDMIDTTKFDVSTLQMTDASHSCVTKISNTNKVEFIFENINLPFNDATNDGYVVFKIKTKPTLVVGNTISNSANIYFDYNFPIVTNTATSTFQTLANNDFYLDKNVSLSPIPTKDTLTISLQDSEKINSVSIYNMLGQVVQTVIGSNNIINVSELKTGDYIIKITTEKGTMSKKFIKE